MAEDDAKLKEMDEAAVQAKEELKQHLNQWTAKDVVAWQTKWYLKAGHKRLGRAIVDLGKEKK